MINSWTLQEDNLWLTPDETHQIRTGSQMKPNFRRLQRAGGEVEKTKSPIKVYATNGQALDFRYDARGHIWVATDVIVGWRGRSALKFAYPYICHLGLNDGTPKIYLDMRSYHPFPATLCSAAVKNLIIAAGLLGRYFPAGEAQTSVTIAKQEIEIFRQQCLDALTAKNQAAIQNLDAQIDTLKKEKRKDQAEIKKLSEAITKLEDSLGLANKIVQGLTADKEELERQLATATRETQRHIEALKRARAENPGWDWTNL